MLVSKIMFKNIMGLESYSIQPGLVTKISAPNGAGKTSMADAINSILDGGAHESRLLRNGQEVGETVFEIDDGMSINKKITKDSSTLKVRDESGRAMAKPVSVLQTLFTKASANPISFFTADKKDRKKILLTAMPIKADPARLEAITGQKISVDGNAWDVINTVYKQIEIERRDTNRAADGKRKSVAEVKLALPKDIDVETDSSAITEQITQVDADKDAKIAKIDAYLAGFRNKHAADSKELNRRIEGETKEIRDEIEVLKQKIKGLEKSIEVKESEGRKEQDKLDSDLAEQNRKAADARSARTNEWRDARGDLDRKMKDIDAINEQRGRVKQSLENIKTWTEEAESLESDSAKKTEMLHSLEAYKTELMETLPVPGLEVRGDDIYHNGIVWEGLNEAKRMEIAFEIALLQCGKIPFMFVDGAERLDAKNFKLFVDRAVEKNVQCLLFEVDRSDDAQGLKTEVLA